MAEKRTRAEKALRQAGQLEESSETSPEENTENRRKEAIRSGEERRKINIPPAPGSPVRSGLDRRARDRRGTGRPQP